MTNTAPLLIAFTAILFAASNPSDVDSPAAFTRLKTLAGKWQADTPMGKAYLDYEVVADGASLVERETYEHMATMLTVYSMDNGRLVLTHYCETGNQPHMRATSFDPATGELKFDFVDAGNLPDKNAMHMHDATFHIVDADHLATAWDMFEGGRTKMLVESQFTRVR